MNKDSEALQDLFAWLLQDPPTDVSTLAGTPSSPGYFASHDGVEDLELADIDPLDSEEVSPPLSNRSASDGMSPDRGGQQLTMGEIPAVQDRFYAIVKRQLKSEIQRHLPCFPWESDVLEYPDYLFEEQVPNPVWLVQLQTLNLPVRLPETILAQLLDRCSEVVRSGLREGAQLVRAVEALFPGQSPSLNYWADLVLRPATRSSKPEIEFPDTYELATPTQQMVLSLMAAREIMGNLTLKLSSSQRKVERQWLTAAGLLTLETEYQTQGRFPRLRIQSQLPCGGSLQMQSGDVQSTAQRPDTGCVSVEVFDPQPGQTYALEVRFQNLDQKPLMLAVYLAN